jgi:hypothetical protein
MEFITWHFSLIIRFSPLGMYLSHGELAYNAQGPGFHSHHHMQKKKKKIFSTVNKESTSRYSLNVHCMDESIIIL